MQLTVDLTIPDYAKGKFDKFLLIKIVSNKDYCDYFRSGKLYMRTHTEFTKEELGNGVSDLYEGIDVLVYPTENRYAMTRFEKDEDGNTYFVINEYDKKPDDYIENNFFAYTPCENRFGNIFCLYTLWYNSKTGEMSSISDNVINSFGNYGVVIFDTRWFFNEISIALGNRSDINIANCGFVDYYSIKNRQEAIIDWNPFKKNLDDFYEQNEFRFYFRQNKEELLEFDMNSDIKKVTATVNIKQFINSIRICNEKIYFKGLLEDSE